MICIRIQVFELVHLQIGTIGSLRFIRVEDRDSHSRRYGRHTITIVAYFRTRRMDTFGNVFIIIDIFLCLSHQHIDITPLVFINLKTILLSLLLSSNRSGMFRI
jgi:hypothetical protein